MSTCNQLVRNECANFCRGNCIFTERACPVIESKPCKMPHTCSLGFAAFEGAPSYFEVAVLPLSKSDASYAKCVREYSGIKGEKSVVEILECACGKPRLSGHTYCPKCKKKKRAENQRKYKAVG